MRLFDGLRSTIRREALWAKHSREWTKLVEEHPLRYLFFEVTRRCNLECAYCGSECTPEQVEGELSSDDWIKVVRQIAEDFDPPKVMIAVTGGEPLMKRGIFDIFRELQRHGFHYGMVTNGYRLNAKMAQKLMDAGWARFPSAWTRPLRSTIVCGERERRHASGQRCKRSKLLASRESSRSSPR